MSQPDTPPLRIDESGSPSPRDFQRLIQDTTFWPKRSTRITRSTHDAIVFALEAIRSGSGVNPKPLTADLLEEQARMSDLLRGDPPGPLPVSGRSQNGGAAARTAAAAAEAGPTPTGPPRYRTPTEVMRERRAREARRADEAASEQQRQLLLQAEQEESRRRQEERVVGVVDDPNTRRTTRRVSNQPTQANPSAGPPTQLPTSARRQENVPPVPDPTQARIAAQQRPVQQHGIQRVISANTQRNRTQAYDQLTIPVTARPMPATRPDQSQPQQSLPTQPGPSNIPQPPAPQPVTQQQSAPATHATRARFPNAFDRWEELSSHWEGVVSSFLRRLQENENELAAKPIDRQIARQIEDLSAAGANLFHAVVELQRLRASSERKFQRWFFETRNDQEQAAARQADLEQQLVSEREARSQGSTSIEAALVEQAKSEELVKEMRRELQISKEEARRAWEELGRREQEERERTIALRSGEPTLIGGVQVVPMQGLPSRQISTVQRPQTRDGPAGGAGPGILSGMSAQDQMPLPVSRQGPPSRSQTTTTSLDSPGEESRQFNFQPGGPEPEHSPTVTDPYTDSTRHGARSSPQQQHSLRHEPDSQFYTVSPPRVTQPPTSAAAVAAARAVTSGALGQLPSQSYPQPPPMRSGTAGTDRSFIPSTGSAASEEEYYINPDGTYTRDDHGRRIPYLPAARVSTGAASGLGQHQLGGESDIGEIPSSPISPDDDDDDDDDDDHAADAERERTYAAQYRQQQDQPRPRQPQQSGSQPQYLSSSSSGTAAMPRSSPSSLAPIPQGQEVMSPDYEGAGYGSSESPGTGWEGINVQTRHRHPTRLSDIIEEQTARTSPSRTSYVSGGAGGAGGPFSASESLPLPTTTAAGFGGSNIRR